MLGYVWSLWDQNLGLNQVTNDWHVLSWAARWLDDPAGKVMYKDQRKAKNISDDKDILKSIWELLDEADIVIGQNSKQFDVKKLNARFIANGFQPPSSFKQIDTLQIAKRHFAFTSNKLEYMSEKLCTKYKKLKHKKFPGFELWSECLKGNTEAWDEMKKYNIHDVLATEELYKKLIPWDSTINFALYEEKAISKCSCGGTDFRSRGYYYTAAGKYQRSKCNKCGAETRSKINLFDVEKRKSLKAGTVR